VALLVRWGDADLERESMEKVKIFPSLRKRMYGYYLAEFIESDLTKRQPTGPKAQKPIIPTSGREISCQTDPSRRFEAGLDCCCQILKWRAIVGIAGERKSICCCLPLSLHIRLDKVNSHRLARPVFQPIRNKPHCLRVDGFALDANPDSSSMRF
jgi:hypothetical protein